MTWAHPKRRPETGQTVDAEDHNDSWLPFSRVIYGGLTASNFDAAAMKAGWKRDSGMAPDIAHRLSVKHAETNVINTPSYGAIDCAQDGGAGLLSIPANGLWHRTDTQTRTFTSRGGMLHIMATGQTIQDAHGGITNVGVAYIQVAAALDGVVIAESIPGDLDPTASDQLMEVGLSGEAMAYLTAVTVPIAPGNHTVEVLYRAFPLDPTFNPGSSPTMDPDCRIGARELILWETAS